jgi:hypothetical protein
MRRHVLLLEPVHAVAYTVVGVQFASECYASRNETAATQYGPSTACTMGCNGGDAMGACGGGLANSLYRLPAKPTPPPNPNAFWVHEG